MSSLIAHLAAGATAYACRPSAKPRAPDRLLLAACLLLAVLPDLDYLLWWGWRMPVEPRITHSLGFALASAGLAWLVLRGRGNGPVLFAAAVSHELLDFLVGVHPAPWLWPVVGAPFTSPLGVLPSAGRLDLGNAYLWRNLFIELGLLGPLMLALCATRQPALRLAWPTWLGLSLLALASLAWSLSLPR